jgi:hypothetical protein
MPRSWELFGLEGASISYSSLPNDHSWRTSPRYWYIAVNCHQLGRKPPHWLHLSCHSWPRLPLLAHSDSMLDSPSAGYSSSRVGSPSPPSVSRSSNEYPQFHRSPSVSDFQIEHIPKSYVIHRSIPPAEPGVNQALAFRDSVSRLLAARSRPFSVCRGIPLDSSQLSVLFFRSKVGFSCWITSIIF